MDDRRQRIERGKEALERGNYTEAVGSLSRAAHEHPGYADVRNWLGLALHLAGHSEEAVQQFRHALEINPRYTEVHLNLALVLNDLGRLEEARASFGEAAGTGFPGPGELSSPARARLAHLHAETAGLYALNGRAAEACEEYRRALALEPDFHDIRARLARTHLESGSFTLAASEFAKIVARKPGDLQARLGLGLAHFHQGDRELARRIWEGCRESDPDDPAVKVYLAMA